MNAMRPTKNNYKMTKPAKTSQSHCLKALKIAALRSL